MDGYRGKESAVILMALFHLLIKSMFNDIHLRIYVKYRQTEIN